MSDRFSWRYCFTIGLLSSEATTYACQRVRTCEDLVINTWTILEQGWLGSVSGNAVVRDPMALERRRWKVFIRLQKMQPA
jgi:hypothetical protein